MLFDGLPRRVGFRDWIEPFGLEDHSDLGFIG